MPIEWIPVSERLPVNDDPVLTWGEAITAGIRLQSKALGITRYGYGPDRGRFQNEAEADRWARFTKLKVTHWTPLTPPKGTP